MNEIQRNIEEFCRFLLTEKSASVNTVAAYRSDLGQLADFMRTRPITGGWGGLDRSTTQDFILDLKARGYTKTSVARKIAAARSFFAYLVAEGLVADNPTEGLVSPKVGTSLPKTASPNDINRLLEQPTRRSTPEAKRDHAMLKLLYATGMRITELVSLDMNDLKLNLGSLSVCCASGERKERTIPVYEPTLEALTDYLKKGRPKLLKWREEEQALFVNRRGERLTRQGFWFILKGYARSAHLSKNITPHTLRHSFAAHMISGGMRLRNVQEMLGHANISTTQQMYHTQVARQTYERAHPRA